METDRPNSKAKIITSIIILVVVVVIVFGAKALTSRQSGEVATSSNTAPASASSAVSADSTDTAQTYKDGTYSATGNYDSPGGNESIDVSITIRNNTVASTSAQSGANDPTAEQFQADFIGGYQSMVVGKNINTIHLSHVSGSSLTSQGFNDALAQIRNQAKT